MKFRLRSLAVTLMSLLTLTVGCASLPIANPPEAKFCTNLDWFEIGRVDGALGGKEDREKEYANRCSEGPHRFESELYQNGRNAGLIEYCTATVGFEAGRSNATYEHVCPDHLEKSFLENYALGAKVRALESDNQDLQTRIDNLVGLLAPRQVGGSVQAQIEQLRNLRVKNETEIGSLENRIRSERF